MRFDGGDWQAGDVGDLGEREFLDEAQEEDAALALGEAADRLPDECELLVGDEGGVGRAGGMGEVGGEVFGLHGGAGGSAPEAEALGAGVVADKVEGDAGEPGCGGALAAKVAAGGPGAEEGLLGEGFGGVAIAERGEEKAEDAWAVESVEGIDVREGKGGDGRVE